MPAIISYGNNEFRVLKKLGEGAFGTVYKVESQKSRHYALKMIPLQAGDAKARAEVQHEVQILKCQANRHNNVIKYYDSWFRGSELCILMEFAPNGTLLDYIDHARESATYIPEMEVVHMLKQMLSALDFFHTKLNVVHRDVKPENIMATSTHTTDQTTYKLIDFSISARSMEAGAGLSDQGSDTTGTARLRANVGTAHFMSPEQHTEGLWVAEQSDLWNLGATMFTVLTGNPPIAPDKKDTYAISIAVRDTNPESIKQARPLFLC